MTVRQVNRSAIGSLFSSASVNSRNPSTIFTTESFFLSNPFLALAIGCSSTARSSSAAGLGGAGEVRTRQIDLDFKCKNGRSLPVRLLHRVAYGQDGAPGASRTLALNRASGEQPEEDLRAAEVKFARFFNSTPMAIATLDENGRVVRSNAAFAQLLPRALAGGQAGKSAPAWPLLTDMSERDRAALKGAIEAALDSRGDVKPVDVVFEDASQGETGRIASSDPMTARSVRFFVSPDENAGKKAAMIYALDTTAERKLQEEFAQSLRRNNLNNGSFMLPSLSRFDGNPAARIAHGDDPRALEHRIGLRSAVLFNVLEMIGVGPFITLPLVIAGLGFAVIDMGMGAGRGNCCRRWPRLGRVGRGFSSQGGSYAFLREIYGPEGAGNWLSFLYVWQVR